MTLGNLIVAGNGCYYSLLISILLLSRVKMVDYKVTVFTGSLDHATTFNNVYIKLVGTDGESDRTLLRDYKQPLAFIKGAVSLKYPCLNVQQASSTISDSYVQHQDMCCNAILQHMATNVKGKIPIMSSIRWYFIQKFILFTILLSATVCQLLLMLQLRSWLSNQLDLHLDAFKPSQICICSINHPSTLINCMSIIVDVTAPFLVIK